MFSLATGIYQSYFAPPKLSILIIGLDGSGKTSLLERIKVTDVQTRIGVTPACNAPSLPASYAKGAAIAGVGNSNCIEVSANGSEKGLLQPQQTQKHSGGGRPARLPPPLPPRQALKSHRHVETMLEGGFATGNASDSNGVTAARSKEQLLQSVPPPPLVASDADGSDGYSSEVDKKVKPSASSAKPPRHGGKKKSPAAIPVATKKKGSFLELLRCPSPKKYSDAALGEDDDDFVEYQENNNNNPASSSQKDSLEPWSTEYLENYYINYQEGEEFDIRRQRNAGGVSQAKKMFPLERIRPTLGQNLAKNLDLCGCKCSLFDLSGAEKMRPLWERYYRDTDAIIYVVNAAEPSSANLHQSRRDFERTCQNDALRRRVQCGLPILVFANKLDLTYREYEASMEKANNERNGRGISWNAEEEDDFVGGGSMTNIAMDGEEEGCSPGSDVARRAVDFPDLAALFGFPQLSQPLGSASGTNFGSGVQQSGMGNVFLFGGSAKSGEGVRAAMEYLVAHAKSYHLSRDARR